MCKELLSFIYFKRHFPWKNIRISISDLESLR